MPNTQQTMDKMAEEIFELYRLIAIARSRQPSGAQDLSEGEFLALDVLAKEAPLTIGDVQKRIGVVPAQMSRIVRSLEVNRGKGFLSCEINQQDRRRVDVQLTDEGQQACKDYRTNRLASMRAVLDALVPEDRIDFMRMLHCIRQAFAERLDIDTGSKK